MGFKYADKLGLHFFVSVAVKKSYDGLQILPILYHPHRFLHAELTKVGVITYGKTEVH
jgi:hypothetical protein